MTFISSSMENDDYTDLAMSRWDTLMTELYDHITQDKSAYLPDILPLETEYDVPEDCNFLDSELPNISDTWEALSFHTSPSASEKSSSEGSSHSSETSELQQFPHNSYRPSIVFSQRTVRDQWTHYVSPELHRNPESLLPFFPLKEINIRCVSLSPSPSTRLFLPKPLAGATFVRIQHSNTQKLILFGGINPSKGVDDEFYEFVVPMGTWLRKERKHLPSPGLFGYAMVEIPSYVAPFHDRKACRVGTETDTQLAVIGGIGVGGVVPNISSISNPVFKRRLEFLGLSINEKSRTLFKSSRFDKYEKLGIVPSTPEPLGFHSLLYNINRSTGKWEAIQLAWNHPIAFHSLVEFKGHLYLFGGIFSNLSVSNSLIAINREDWSTQCFVPKSSQPSPSARFAHQAVVYGRWMIVSGGFNSENEPLGEIWAFDLTSASWSQLSTQNPDSLANEASETHPNKAMISFPPRACHGMTMVEHNLFIVGGFATSLGACGECAPSIVSTIIQVSLIPDENGNFNWVERHSQPDIPSIALSAVENAGDGRSLLIYGGVEHASSSLEGLLSKENSTTGKSIIRPSHSNNGTSNRCGKHLVSASETAQHKGLVEVARPNHLLGPFWNSLRILPGHFFILTCVDINDTKSKGAGESVDALSSSDLSETQEIPELTPEFKAFLKRQSDFIKKKAYDTQAERRRILLRESEEADMRLYLTAEEVDSILAVCRKGLEIVQGLPPGGIPASVPNAALRLNHIEGFTTFLRQLIDVTMSMKPRDEPVVLAPKKTRHKTGEKFVSFDSVKPFRRAVIQDLLDSMEEKITQLQKMNVTLQNSFWSEKEAFVAYTGSVREACKAIIRRIQAVQGSYAIAFVKRMMEYTKKRELHLQAITDKIKKAEAHGSDYNDQKKKSSLLIKAKGDSVSCSKLLSKQREKDNVNSIHSYPIHLTVGETKRLLRWIHSLHIAAKRAADAESTDDTTIKEPKLPLPLEELSRQTQKTLRSLCDALGTPSEKVFLSLKEISLPSSALSQSTIFAVVPSTIVSELIDVRSKCENALHKFDESQQRSKKEESEDLVDNRYYCILLLWNRLRGIIQQLRALQMTKYILPRGNPKILKEHTIKKSLTKVHPLEPYPAYLFMPFSGQEASAEIETADAEKNSGDSIFNMKPASLLPVVHTPLIPEFSPTHRNTPQPQMVLPMPDLAFGVNEKASEFSTQENHSADNLTAVEKIRELPILPRSNSDLQKETKIFQLSQVSSKAIEKALESRNLLLKTSGKD